MRLKEPPMIVLMDILALFLFVFMLNKPPSLKIVLPEGLPSSDCYEIVRDKKDRLYVWVQGEKRSYQSVVQQYIFAFRIPCNAAAEGCKLGEGILIVGDTAQKAMKRFANVCFSPQHQCNVTLSIARTGAISIDSIAKMRP